MPRAPARALPEVMLRAASGTPDSCTTSKLIRIERRRASGTKIVQRFLGHSLERIGRGSSEEFIPPLFGFDLGKQPRSDRFLLGFRKLVRCFYRAFEKLSHHPIVRSTDYSYTSTISS